MHLVHHLIGHDRRPVNYPARLALSTLERLGLLDLDGILADLEIEPEPAEVAVHIEPGDLLGLMLPEGERGRLW